jgi:hypothetical protein
MFPKKKLHIAKVSACESLEFRPPAVRQRMSAEPILADHDSKRPFRQTLFYSLITQTALRVRAV